MDADFVSRSVFVLPDDAGERWIHLLVFNSVFNTFPFKKFNKPLPHEVGLLSVPLPLVWLEILLELQVLEYNAFVLLLGILDDFLHQATEIIVSLMSATIQDAVVDETLGFNQVAILAHAGNCDPIWVCINTNDTVAHADVWL
ncbi:MAG: hypothetical protein WC346_20785, partial [Methanogenium sp.]